MYHSLLHRSAERARGRSGYEPPNIEFPGLEGEVSWDPRPISRNGSERLIRYGFELAKYRQGSPEGNRKITCVDKSNVTRGCQLFRRVFDEVSSEHPEFDADHAYIDAFTQWLVRNPEWFDVVVTSNMFGDIATDLGSVLQGGMGMAASGNIGDNHAFFEPVHGSAPKYAGKNQVNPIATLSSVQMMIEWLGHKNSDAGLLQISNIIEQSIGEQIKEGKTLTYDLGGDSSTSEVGTQITQRVTSLLAEM